MALMTGEPLNDEELLEHALRQARVGLLEGGVPIGAALSIGGKLRAVGRNRRVQTGSAIRHAEIDCIDNAGRLSLQDYAHATIATTHSPCLMCAGAMVQFGFGRIVIGADVDFDRTRPFLDWAGADYILKGIPEPLVLLRKFIAEQPDAWNEDIGVASRPASLSRTNGPNRPHLQHSVQSE